MNTHCSKKKNAILRNRIFKIKVELKTATYSVYILYWVFNQHFIQAYKSCFTIICHQNVHFLTKIYLNHMHYMSKYQVCCYLKFNHSYPQLLFSGVAFDLKHRYYSQPVAFAQVE